jgi:hypothetical protein
MKTKIKKITIGVSITLLAILILSNLSSAKLAYYNMKQINNIEFAQSVFANNEETIFSLQDQIDILQVKNRSLNKCAETNRNFW